MGGCQSKYILCAFIAYKGRRVGGVKYYIGGHRALTNISPTSQDMNYRAPISNEETSGWASQAEGGNVSQAPKETLGPRKNEEWREGISL